VVSAAGIFRSYGYGPRYFRRLISRLSKCWFKQIAAIINDMLTMTHLDLACDVGELEKSAKADKAITIVRTASTIAIQ
jgi:hypothetical protein